MWVPGTLCRTGCWGLWDVWIMTQKVRGFIATCLRSEPMAAQSRAQERHRSLPRRAGTTLIEIAICIVIVGTGVAALMQFMASATNVNRINTQTSMAIQYARAGWETAVAQGFGNVIKWTDGSTEAIKASALSPASAVYTRKIWAEGVSINDLNGAAETIVDGTDTLRVNVEISANKVLVYKQSWLLTKP